MKGYIESDYEKEEDKNDIWGNMFYFYCIVRVVLLCNKKDADTTNIE